MGPPAQRGCTHNIPHAVQRRHDANEEHYEAQRLSMSNEPAAGQQSHSQQYGEDGQPVPLAPPERQQEADTQNDAGDLAGDDVEATKREQSSHERRPEVARGQREGGDAAAHVRHTALARIQADALDASARQQTG